MKKKKEKKGRHGEKRNVYPYTEKYLFRQGDRVVSGRIPKNKESDHADRKGKRTFVEERGRRKNRGVFFYLSFNKGRKKNPWFVREKVGTNRRKSS